ncbi:putative Longin-like domain superfamily protein [Helianthus annuus]|nr:putative Longin-like domain superfamily protein [Helianthus annuus]
MNWSPNSIFYTCIAKHTTILAEFNPNNSSHLTDLANKCLEKTPAFHSVFSHTVHNRTYMFFINDPFVYFGIFDHSLDKHNCLLFLKNVEQVFSGMIEFDKLSSGTMNPSSHCLQRELSPVFRQLVGAKWEMNSKDGSDEDDGISSRCRCRCVWDKQVMVVLCMDVVVCVSLFVIWLWVCDGFRCVTD